ncbi:hypothetical protein ACFLZK_00075 [Patescibacteria group bacterium]
MNKIKVKLNIEKTLIISTAIVLFLFSLSLPFKTEQEIDKQSEFSLTTKKAYELLYSYPDMKSMLKVYDPNDLHKSLVPLVMEGYEEIEAPILMKAPIKRGEDYVFEVYPAMYSGWYGGPAFGTAFVGKHSYLTFVVNVDENTVKPYFEDLENNENIEGDISVIVPNSNTKVDVPKKHSIEIDKEGKLIVKSNKLSFILNGCSYQSGYRGYKQSQLCIDLLEMLSEEQIEEIKSETIHVSVRVVETNLDQESWALDNVSYQGQTLRDLVELEGEEILGEYVTFGNNEFYKIGEGCCGDNSVSYIYREPGNDRLIFITNRLTSDEALFSLLESVNSF